MAVVSKGKYFYDTVIEPFEQDELFSVVYSPFSKELTKSGKDFFVYLGFEFDALEAERKAEGNRTFTYDRVIDYYIQVTFKNQNTKDSIDKRLQRWKVREIVESKLQSLRNVTWKTQNFAITHGENEILQEFGIRYITWEDFKFEENPSNTFDNFDTIWVRGNIYYTLRTQ